MRLRSVAHRAMRRRRGLPALPDMAWFDRPDADDLVDEHADTADDRAVLQSWVRDGYAIVEQVVPQALIDEMLADLDRVFTGDLAHPDLEILDLQFGDGHRAKAAHHDLMRVDRDERIAIRDRSNWRMHGFYRQSRAADRIRELPELRRLASMILGVDSHAPYSINFHNGSTQTLHEDSAVFHLGVPNLICGVWIACEDVEDGSGPLAYHPGSHRRQMFDGFEGYPYTNRRTASRDLVAAYQHHVDTVAERFERRTFLARKGDALFWHGMLVHGGEPIRRPDVTRRSYVVHFIPDGADVSEHVTGPTNW